MRIVIIGNGPAAVSAVEAMRQHDAALSITVIAAESARPYTPCFLGKYVAGRIDVEKLALRSADFYSDLDVQVLSGRRAVRVLPDAHEVELDDGQRLAYERLLIACGASPVIPEIPGIEGPGIVSFRDLDDAEAIRACAPDVRHAVILGSGFVALEAAEALAELGTEVSVIVRTDRILRRLFDEQVGGMVQQHAEAHGVRFIKQHELVDVERDAGALRAVVLDDGSRLPCELLVLAVGMRPSVDLLRGTDVAIASGILTDASMRSSVPDIWAAGDVAEPEVAGVRKVNLIHPNAVLTGRIAGLSIVGVQRPMSNHFNDMNVLTLFGRSFLSVGTPAEGGTLVRAAGPDALLKVFTDDGVVTGVQMVGNVTRGGLYAALLGRKLPEGVEDRLLAPDFNFGDIETWPFAS